MKEFFKNKTNIFLLLVLITLICLGSFLGYKFLKAPAVKAVDFTTMNETEILNWAKENGIEEKLEITHQFDDEVKEGEVIYFSVKEGEEIEDKLLIIISNGKDTSDEIVITYDENTTIDDLKEFFKTNNFINITYIYDENSNLESGHIISVSPTSAAIDDAVTVTVAGSEEEEGTIEVPDLNYYSDDEASKWAKTNGVTIKYVYENNTKTKGTILRQSPTAGKMINKGDIVTLTLSSGTTANTSAYIDPYAYLGKTSNDFVTALTNLGFTNLKKLDSIYSDKYAKDTICYYLPDGSQNLTTEISYKISLGTYEFNAESFKGLTKAEGESLISSLKTKQATVEELKVTETETTSYTNGTLYDCSLSSNTVSCKLAKNTSTSSDTTTVKTAYIDPYDYLGKSEDSFKTSLTKLGFTNIKKEASIYSNLYSKDNVCYYLPDGDQKTNTEIVYKLSLGKYSFDESTFKGKTKQEGETLVSELKAKGAPIESLEVTETTTSSYTNGTLYDCSLNGKKVACKLAKNSSSSSSSTSDTAYIDPNAYFGKTEAEFIKTLNNLGFTNLTKTNIYSNGTKGTVRAYLPDGNQNKSTTIKYSVSIGSFNKSDYQGLTVEQASSKVNALNNDGANITFKTSEVETSSYTAGTLYDCSITTDTTTYAAQTLTCKLAKATETKEETKKEEVTKQTIIEFDTLTSFYSKSTYAASETAIKNYFSTLGFTNVTCSGTSSNKSVGTILSISVNGNTDYAAGSYALDTPIVISISNELK